MLLYHLTNPPEDKFGGILTEEETKRCQSQMLLESPRWAPYPQKSCQVENICGRFALGVQNLDGPTVASSYGPPMLDAGLKSVCVKVYSPFGPQTELFHTAGHVTYRATPGLPKSLIFKGVKGETGLVELRRGMSIADDVMSVVHLGVVGCNLGVRLQTTQDCYLENKVNGWQGGFRGGWLAVGSRAMDQCNIIRLSVTKWDTHSDPLLPVGMVPKANDIVITGRGSFMHRFHWAGLVWSPEVEAQLLRGCERVAASVLEALA